MNNLTSLNNNANLDVLSLKEKISDYAQHAFAKNTLINYESDWKNFSTWCKSSNIDPLSVDHKILILYITVLAEKKYKASTIQRKISAILKYCEMKAIKLDLDNREFKIVWQGIRRKLGIAKKGKEPILVKTLKAILEAIPQNINNGIRDKALLSFGWASAMHLHQEEDQKSWMMTKNWRTMSLMHHHLLSY